MIIPKELETTAQYPACSHEDSDYLTLLVEIEMVEKWKRPREIASLHHCAKCGRVFDLNQEGQEITGKRLFDILAKQRRMFADAMDEIRGQAQEIMEIFEV